MSLRLIALLSLVVRAAGISSALLVAAYPASAAAHELTENRATLVKREDRHILMTLYLDWPKTFSAILEPGRQFKEFILLYAALPAPEFAKRVAEAQAYLQNNIRLTETDGTDPAMSQWRFPTPDRLQNDIRTIAAQMLTAPDGRHHDEPVMVQAEFLMAKPVQGVRVTFPEEMQPVLIVSYMPKQIWSRRADSLDVAF